VGSIDGIFESASRGGRQTVDREYWERIGDDYERDIFASSLSDKRGVIRGRLDELANPRGVVADFGCGVGHYLPLLAKRFRAVHGIDFAEALLEQAGARCGALENVSIHRANLASGRARIRMPAAAVGVCANVLISPEISVRRRILRTIRRHLLRGAKLLLLVPSLEAELFCSQMQAEWNRRLGFPDSEATASGIPTIADAVRGVVPIERVPTKHYLREELEVLLDEEGFTVSSCDKVEYGWESEFEDPPRWMKGLGPWDWLVVATSRG